MSLESEGGCEADAVHSSAVRRRTTARTQLQAYSVSLESHAYCYEENGGNMSSELLQGIPHFVYHAKAELCSCELFSTPASSALLLRALLYKLESIP